LLIIGLSVVAGALVLSYLCVAGFRHCAAELILDIPNERSSHTRPTPRGGGFGIVIGVLIGVWSLLAARIISVPLREVMAISLGAGLVALVGWLDDIRRLSYRIRLAVQAISSAIILVAIGHFHTITAPFIGEIHLRTMGIPFALIWIMGLTNAYNFMDGIDGIAGGQALIAGSGWAIMGFMSGQPFVGLIGVLLAATSLGFLFHNWPPARIFMGDVGSAFIGFILAVLPVIAGQKNARFMIAGALLVWPFIFDASITLARRMMHKENVFEAHRSHVYQRLVVAGYSHRFVTLIYIGLALIGAILAFLWVKDAWGSDILVILIPMLLFFGLWRIAIRAEKRSHPSP
jgi:UDP-N-acetylmuramyl pentapeptide phosphotransferase/UDP-N-acetylglucosamine-1-phosphate transferase